MGADADVGEVAGGDAGIVDIDRYVLAVGAGLADDVNIQGRVGRER